MRKRLGGSLLSPRVALSLEGNPRAPLPTTRARHQLLCWPPPQLAPSAAAAASGNARIGVRLRARPSSLSFSLPHNTTRSSFGRWLQPPPGAHPPPACPPQTWRRLPRPVPACPVPLRRRRTSLLIPRSTSRSAAAQAGRALTGAARLLRHGGEGSLHRRAGSRGSLPPVASSYSPPPRRLRRLVVVSRVRARSRRPRHLHPQTRRGSNPPSPAPAYTALFFGSSGPISTASSAQALPRPPVLVAMLLSSTLWWAVVGVVPTTRPAPGPLFSASAHVLVGCGPALCGCGSGTTRWPLPWWVAVVPSL
jgi:hypothetical protein